MLEFKRKEKALGGLVKNSSQPSPQAAAALKNLLDQIEADRGTENLERNLLLVTWHEDNIEHSHCLLTPEEKQPAVYLYSVRSR